MTRPGVKETRPKGRLTGVVERARHVGVALLGMHHGLVPLSAGHDRELGHVTQELVIEEEDGRPDYRRDGVVVGRPSQRVQSEPRPSSGCRTIIPRRPVATASCDTRPRRDASEPPRELTN